MQTVTPGTFGEPNAHYSPSKISIPLNDDDIDDFQWIRLSMANVESMAPGYHWIGIEIVNYVDKAFNTCVTNDRKADTFGSDNIIVDGMFEGLDEFRKTEHDMVYLFE